MLNRIRHKTGLNRYTVETSFSQHQQSANKRDMGVRLPDLPPRAVPSSATEMAPQRGRLPAPSEPAATGAVISPAASPNIAVTPSPARSETALVAMHADSADVGGPASPHSLIGAMKQGAADLHDVIETQFGHVEQVRLSKSLLRQALQNLGQTASHAAPAGLPGMPAVLLAQSLAVATEADTTRALAALAALRRLDPVGDIVAAWHEREHGDVAAALDERDAWRVAMELAATPSGMRVLQTVVATPVAPAQESDFSLLLKTASAISARDATLATPTSMLASTAPPTALLGEALACAAARLAGDMEAARPNDWALNAVRNDLFDTGPGSDFAAVDTRIMKMGRWIEHATGDRRLQLRNPFKDKSAFRALRHGAQQVDRGLAVARHRKAFDAALRDAATQLRDQLITLGPLAKAGGPAQVPQELFRAAVLDHCLAAPAGVPLDGRQFDAAAIDDVAARLSGLLAEAGAGTVRSGAHGQGLVEHLKSLPPFQKLASTRLRMENLGEWLTDALKTHAALPSGWAEPRPSWADGIADKLQRAHHEVRGHDTRMPRVTREGIRNALKHIVHNIEGSSRLRLSSGGIVGAGLRQVSAAVSALASGLLLRGRIDARRQWARQAVFEIAMPPYDMEIMIATQKQRARQLGGGVFIGASLGVVKAGGNLDVTAYARESSTLRGVTLRLPRIGRPVSELRAEFDKLVDRLLDGTAPEARNRPEPLLKQLLQEFPALTVNRVGRAGDARNRHGATAEAVATASVPMTGLRVSASAGAAVEAQRGVVRHYEDASGSIQVERHIAGWGVRGGLGARLSAGPTFDAGPVNLSSGNTDTVLVAGSVDLANAGSARRREQVYQDGRLHPISFEETEYQNLDTFLVHMQTRREEWVQARVAAPGTERDHETEHVNLQAFLDEISRQTTPTHSFAFRSTITPEAAARIDAYRSTGQLAQRLAQSASPQAARAAAAAAQAAAQAAVEEEWANPASLQPYSLRAYERAATQRTAGLNLITQFGAFHAADASHIDNRLDAT